MLKVNDRVYDIEAQANGEVMEVLSNDRYVVRYFWAHYCEIGHDGPYYIKGYNWKGYLNPANRKVRTVPGDYLVKSRTPGGKHRIAMVNQRITDKRLHLVAEIPYASEGPADIYIRYGGNLNHNGGFCINETFVIDKWHQMQLLGEDLVMQSTRAMPKNQRGWVIKPHRSCGGKNIRLAVDDNARYGLDYYQKRFPKVREFRAHTFLWNDNPVPFIQEKVIADQNQLCWNKKQGGSFRYVYQDGLDYGKYLSVMDNELHKRMSDMSVEALKRLKYDSGGIDFGMAADGTLKIFEVNSAMGLRERSLFTYKDVYWKLANLDINKYKEERWNV